MKVVAFQHYPTEPMGYIEEILEKNGVDFEYIRVYQDYSVVDKRMDELKTATHLVFMGGPMGVYEESKYPFLSKEKEIIRWAYKKEIPVIGFCLGAQLIANALGKNVYPFKKEFGWCEVFKVEEDFVTEKLPNSMFVFQWHNDTFDLPEKSKHLYKGNIVPNQAFRVGNMIGLQFHLEVTPEIVKTWLENEEMDVNEKNKILEDTDKYVKYANKLCEKLIEAYLSVRR